MNESLIGIGLYTPVEAARLTEIPAGKLIRCVWGHSIGDTAYAPLWKPQVETEDGSVVLGFRDLLEARVADAFINQGLSAQRVRRAIVVARDLTGEERPLSTTRFRTDGRTVFLQILEEDGSSKLIDLFKSQYAFREIIEPALRDIEFSNGGIPKLWWPTGRASGVLIDPEKAFGQPIEFESGVPVDVLAAAVEAEGSVERAARLWCVKPGSVRRALSFRSKLAHRKAA